MNLDLNFWAWELAVGVGGFRGQDFGFKGTMT